MSKNNEGKIIDKRVRVDTFPWLSTEENKLKQTRMSMGEIAKSGMPRAALLSYLDEEIEEADSCRSMPFACVLLISYAVSCMMHEDSSKVMSVHQSIQAYVTGKPAFEVIGRSNQSHGFGTKNLSSVDSITDIWQWMDLGLIPALFDTRESWRGGKYCINDTTTWRDEDNADSYTACLEQTPPPGSDFYWNATHIPELGMLLNYNRIIGGIRLRQQISGILVADDPVEESKTPPWATTTLAPGATTTNINARETTTVDPLKETIAVCNTNADLSMAIGIPNCVHGLGFELDPEKYDIRHFNDPVREKWLYLSNKNLTILQHVGGLLDESLYLQSIGYVDNHTRRLEISIPTYNAEYNLYTVTTVNFFFSRAGGIWKSVDSLSTYAQLYPTINYLIVDILFLACLVWMLFSEINEIRESVKEEGMFGVFYSYMGVWNAVDWLTVLFGTVFLILLQFNLGYLAALNAEVVKLYDVERVHTKGDATWTRQFRFLYTALDEALYFGDVYRIFMCIFPLIMVLRLFKSFNAQGRLAVITQTFSTAFTDLYHFFVVIVPIYAAFTISGVTLFGQDSSSFTTFSRAWGTLGRSLTSDLPDKELAGLGRYYAMFWFFFVETLLLLVFFNLLIAIWVDSYRQVRPMTRGAEMLWEEARENIANGWEIAMGRMVPSHFIVRALRKDDRAAQTADLVYRSTAPESKDTNRIVGHNLANGTVKWECAFKQKNLKMMTGPPETFLSSEEIPCVGTIIVLDGKGSARVMRKGGLPAAFDVQLDSRGYFNWYETKSSTPEGHTKHSDAQLLQVLKDLENGDHMDLITRHDIMVLVPKLRERQRENLFLAAVINYYEKNFREDGIDELRDSVMHLYHRSQKLHKASQGAKKRTKKGLSTVKMVEDNDYGAEFAAPTTSSNGQPGTETQILTEYQQQCREAVTRQEQQQSEILPLLMGDVFRSIFKTITDAGYELEYSLLQPQDTAYIQMGEQEVWEQKEKQNFDAAVKKRMKKYEKQGGVPLDGLRLLDATEADEFIVPDDSMQIVLDEEPMPMSPFSRQCSHQEPLTWEDVGLGARVTVRRDLRKVLTACHASGLSPDNAALRKAACGKVGEVVGFDKQDRTVLLYFDATSRGQGEIYFALDALRKPTPFDFVEPEELLAQEKERRQYRKNDRDREKDFLKRKEAHVNKLEGKLDQVQEAVEDSLETTTHLRKRLVKQLEKKAKFEFELAGLEAQRADLSKQTKNVGQAAKGGWNQLNDLNKSRTQYLDTVTSLQKEHDSLQWQIEDEEAKFNAYQEVAWADQIYYKDREKEVDHTLRNVQAYQRKARQNSSYFSWLAGKADQVARELDCEDEQLSDFAEDIYIIRNLALQVERSFEGVPETRENRQR